MVGQSWHLDICFYIATAYTVYYIWMGNVWEKVLPRLNFNIDLAAQEKAKFERLHNKEAKIGTWGEPNDEGVPNDQVPCRAHQGRGVALLCWAGCAGANSSTRQS
jgi:hypothetical protein